MRHSFCFYWEKEVESRYYRFSLEPKAYFAPVDTTFALYQNIRHYTIMIDARTTGRYQGRHLPWYYDYEHLPEDERYYLQHANISSTMAETFRQKDKGID